MLFTITDFQFFVLPMRTRFPFKYGIAALTELPHLLVQARLEVAGREVLGLASEGLAPKWFTKNATTTFEADLAEMLAVIGNSARVGRHAAATACQFGHWWRNLYDEVQGWAQRTQQPALLANLGVSLIERAVLDALCKAAGQPLHRLLRENALGIDLGAARAGLAGMAPADCLAAEPLSQVWLRHTVGLGDHLRASEVPAEERLADGLPLALDECIRAYGLRYFKIKLCGRLDIDRPRLREITRVLVEHCQDAFHCTLDGNEQFHDMAAFQAAWTELRADAELAPLFASLIVVEQPLHRDHALSESVAEVLSGWREAPPMIIDEADGALGDLPRALALGYVGTSHKNCKGIVKGLANAALLVQTRRQQPQREFHLTGEDLASVGPVAMLQDLAMAQALGISHLERNGHHYFLGLSAFPAQVQQEVLRVHGDLYAARTSSAAADFPSLRVQAGSLSTASVNAAPFGCGIQVDLSAFEPLNAWIKRGGLAAFG